VQDILASGTVAAAMEAALLGIQSLAFSMEVPESAFQPGGIKYQDFALPARIAAEMALDVLERGLPRRVSILNVNFPWKTDARTKIKVTSIEVRKYKDYVLERKDPRGRPYYWMWGSRLPTFKRSSDVYAVHKLKAISISPLSLDLTPQVGARMREFGARIEARIQNMHNSSLTHK